MMFWSSSTQNSFFCDYINLCAMINIIVLSVSRIKLPVCYILLSYAILCYYLLSYAIVFVFIYVIVILQIRYISLIIISGQIIIYNINMCILMYTETSPMT